MVYNKIKHYTYPELLKRIRDVKEAFPGTQSKIFHEKATLTLRIQPTEVSTEYEVKLIARQGRQTVKIFVTSPKIGKYEGEKKVPHLYGDGSLCLYYPDYNEWCYTDSWAETLIPWTSLWLFYYEIWKETGEWLGGGIHGKKEIPPT